MREGGGWSWDYCNTNICTVRTTVLGYDANSRNYAVPITRPESIGRVSLFVWTRSTGRDSLLKSLQIPNMKKVCRPQWVPIKQLIPRPGEPQDWHTLKKIMDLWGKVEHSVLPRPHPRTRKKVWNTVSSPDPTLSRGTQCPAQTPPSHKEKGLEHFLGCAESAVPCTKTNEQCYIMRWSARN